MLMRIVFDEAPNIQNQCYKIIYKEIHVVKLYIHLFWGSVIQIAESDTMS